MEVLANALDERVRPAPSKTCSCGCPFLGGVLGAWCGGAQLFYRSVVSGSSYFFVMVLLYMEYSMYVVVVSNVVQQCAPSLMLSLRSEGEAKCPCSPKASCPLGCGLNKTQHWCRGELEWPQPILYFNAFDTIPCLGYSDVCSQRGSMVFRVLKTALRRVQLQRCKMSVAFLTSP